MLKIVTFTNFYNFNSQSKTHLDSRTVALSCCYSVYFFVLVILVTCFLHCCVCDLEMNTCLETCMGFYKIYIFIQRLIYSFIDILPYDRSVAYFKASSRRNVKLLQRGTHLSWTILLCCAEGQLITLASESRLTLSLSWENVRSARAWGEVRAWMALTPQDKLSGCIYSPLRSTQSIL